MKRSEWIWPVVILLSAILTALVYTLLPGLALRPLVMAWFLFVCPGMMLIRFLRLESAVVEWTLGIAVSLTLAALLASIQLYASLWSPTATLDILIGLCVVGALVQLTMAYNSSL